MRTDEKLRVRMASGGNGQTVLVVDAEFLHRWMIQTVLEHNGYGALEARDVDEAISVSSECGTAIHAVLIDIAVAGPSPNEAVDRIQRGRPEMRPIFMARAAHGAEFRDLRGLMPMLRKPCGVRTLLATIHAVLAAN